MTWTPLDNPEDCITAHWLNEYIDAMLEAYKDPKWNTATTELRALQKIWFQTPKPPQLFWRIKQLIHFCSRHNMACYTPFMQDPSEHMPEPLDILECVYCKGGIDKTDEC